MDDKNNKISFNSILETLGFPAVLFHKEKGILKINQKIRDHFICQPNTCYCKLGNFELINQEDRLCKTFYLEVIELFLNFPEKKAALFDHKDKIWEIKCKTYEKDTVLIYAINRNYHENVNESIEKLLESTKVSLSKAQTIELHLHEFDQALDKPLFLIQNKEIAYVNYAFSREFNADIEGLSSENFVRTLGKPLDFFMNLCQSYGDKKKIHFHVNIKKENIEYTALAKDVFFNKAPACAIILEPRIFRPLKPLQAKPSILDEMDWSTTNLDLNVLCVDDKPVNLKILKIMLENIGCTVDLACDGKEGVEKIKNKVYDIVFMDILMPIMGGLEASQLIKKMENPPPVIAITAISENLEELDINDYGIKDCIPKPVRAEILYNKLLYWVQ